MDDTQLIALTLNGNQQAYAALVHRYERMVFGIAVRILNDSADAEEIAQDAFVKAYKSLASFRNQSRFSTWLYRIAYHAALSRLRANKKLPKQLDHTSEEIAESSLSSNALETLAGHDRKAAVNRAMQQLHPIDASLLDLYYYQELPLQEVAEITNISLANVKVRLHRARKQMRQLLQTQLQSELNSIL